MVLKDSIDKWLADLAISHSALTVRSYRTALRHLATFLDGVGVDYAAGLTAQLGVDFARALALRDLAPATLAAYINAVTQFYNWLVLEDVIDARESAKLAERIRAMRYTRVPRDNIPDLPSEDAVSAIMNQAMHDPGGTERQNLCRLRNIALLYTLRVTAARVSELTHMCRRDLGERQAIVIGKGNKERILFWTEEAWQALMRYLDLRDGVGKSHGEIDDLPVFARHDRTGNGGCLPLSSDAVRKMLDRLAYEAGVEERVTPHLFRHRAATAVLSQTGNLAATQDILGHASPATTRRYARLAAAQLREAHDQAAALL